MAKPAFARDNVAATLGSGARCAPLRKYTLMYCLVGTNRSVEGWQRVCFAFATREGASDMIFGRQTDQLLIARLVG